MKVLCRHGHFAFYPDKASDIADFSSYYKVTLKRERDYYTFSGLFGADDYSLLGKPYLNLPAIVTYSGEPWEIMRENNFVYHLITGIIVPKLTVVSIVNFSYVGSYFQVAAPLVQPGSRNLLGRQILSYFGIVTDEGSGLRVLEFDYE